MTTPFPGGPPSVQLPVCPRHPDRVSYVRCQRCGRPACPDCQLPAAVGVHCVDCVREANRTAPQARTAFGAPVSQARPVVTYTLIGLSVVSFLLQLTLGTGRDNPWTTALIFAPFLGEIEPWRMLTTAFLHDTGMFLHIGFNMYALWIVGQSLEPALGRWRFIALYVLSALAGSVLVLLLASPTDVSWLTGVVGASGAVFGLFGAILVVLRRLRRNAQSIIMILVINGVLGFVIPNIAWEAHLGGLLVGGVLGFAYAYAPKEHRREVGIAATAGMAVLLVLITMLRYAVL